MCSFRSAFSHCFWHFSTNFRADRACTSFSLLPTDTHDNSLMLNSKIKISNSKFKISISDLATAVRLIHSAPTMQTASSVQRSSKPQIKVKGPSRSMEMLPQREHEEDQLKPDACISVTRMRWETSTIRAGPQSGLATPAKVQDFLYWAVFWGFSTGSHADLSFWLMHEMCTFRAAECPTKALISGGAFLPPLQKKPETAAFWLSL